MRLPANIAREAGRAASRHSQLRRGRCSGIGQSSRRAQSPVFGEVAVLIASVGSPEGQVHFALKERIFRFPCPGVIDVQRCKRFTHASLVRTVWVTIPQVQHTVSQALRPKLLNRVKVPLGRCLSNVVVLRHRLAECNVDKCPARCLVARLLHGIEWNEALIESRRMSIAPTGAEAGGWRGSRSKLQWPIKRFPTLNERSLRRARCLTCRRR
jgi:hypothetical protein